MKSLRDHRLDAGLFLKQVAERVSTKKRTCSHQTIANWERLGLPIGVTFFISLSIKLKGLGIDLMALVKGIPLPNDVRIVIAMAELYDVEISDFPLR